MSGRERLRKIESALRARRVRDIKIAWGALDEKPLSGVIDEVATVLEAYLDGRFKALAPFGDLPSSKVYCWKCGCKLNPRRSDGLLPMHRIPRAYRSQKGPLPVCPGSQTKPIRDLPQEAPHD